jgi:NTE family protein
MLDGRTADLPYYIVATDLISSRPIVFTNDKGAVAQHVAEAAVDPALAVLGSCALPGVFPPVRIAPWLLVDGAFRHYVPVDILRQVGCRKIMVVNLYRLERNWRPRSVIHVLTRSFEILMQESIDNDISGDDILMIRPDVGNMSWLSFHELGDCVRSGRRAVTTQAQRIRAWLEQEQDLADIRPASSARDKAKHPAPWIVRIH